MIIFQVRRIQNVLFLPTFQNGNYLWANQSEGKFWAKSIIGLMGLLDIEEGLWRLCKPSPQLNQKALWVLLRSFRTKFDVMCTKNVITIKLCLVHPKMFDTFLSKIFEEYWRVGWVNCQTILVSLFPFDFTYLCIFSFLNF